MNDIPRTMTGVQLTGHGGLDRLQVRDDLPVPTPGAGEVLIRVRASSVNNTDINTRIGWYSKAVTGATGEAAAPDPEDAAWSGAPIRFPRIQGADCFGDIVAVGDGVAAGRIGEPVLVRMTLKAPVDFRPFEFQTFGSERDGGFAEYTVVPAADALAVASTLSDAELGVLPCAFSTAEGMLHRANAGPDDRILVLGASGGVGSAAVQLAKLRGAEVIAVASEAKSEAVRALGAAQVIPRDAPLIDRLGPKSVTLILDLVGGATFRTLPDLLRRGGRYVTAGAIAGPMVDFDLRTLYLNDLTFYGCAFQEDAIFDNLIRYLAENHLRPAIAATFPLTRIKEAQEMFLAKDFVGKIALVP